MDFFQAFCLFTQVIASFLKNVGIVLKKNDKLVIAYYQADSESYDVVLDSVDTILNSLEIS